MEKNNNRIKADDEPRKTCTNCSIEQPLNKTYNKCEIYECVSPDGGCVSCSTNDKSTLLVCCRYCDKRIWMCRSCEHKDRTYFCSKHCKTKFMDHVVQCNVCKRLHTEDRRILRGVHMYRNFNCSKCRTNFAACSLPVSRCEKKICRYCQTCKKTSIVCRECLISQFPCYGGKGKRCFFCVKISRYCTKCSDNAKGFLYRENMRTMITEPKDLNKYIFKLLVIAKTIKIPRSTALKILFYMFD